MVALIDALSAQVSIRQRPGLGVPGPAASAWAWGMGLCEVGGWCRDGNRGSPGRCVPCGRGRQGADPRGVRGCPGRRSGKGGRAGGRPAGAPVRPRVLPEPGLRAGPGGGAGSGARRRRAGESRASPPPSPPRLPSLARAAPAVGRSRGGGREPGRRGAATEGSPWRPVSPRHPRSRRASRGLAGSGHVGFVTEDTGRPGGGAGAPDGRPSADWRCRCGGRMSVRDTFWSGSENWSAEELLGYSRWRTQSGPGL